MAYNDWGTMTIHYGNTDPAGPTAYDEATIVGTIDTATAYNSITLGILAPQHEFAGGEKEEDMAGELFEVWDVRKQFNVIGYPFDYDDVSHTWDLNVYDSLCSILRTYKYKWISFDAPRAYHSAGAAIPAVFVGMPEIDINAEEGERGFTMKIEKRWKES